MPSESIKRIKEVSVYQNQFLTLFDDEVQFPNNSIGRYLRLKWAWPYNVGIVPVTKDGNAVLIRQFCYARQDWLWQIPKGMGSRDRSPKESAVIEMEEETGYVSTELKFLKSFFVDPGLVETPMHVFVAFNAEQKLEVDREHAEVISDVIEVDLVNESFEQKIEALDDPLSLASLFLTRKILHGKKSPKS